MDVSRIDPEQALVDAETVDTNDLSLEMDGDHEHSLRMLEYGKEDKVLVSVRYVFCIIRFRVSCCFRMLTFLIYSVRPSASSAWSISTSERLLKLQPVHTKSSGSAPTEFRYDEVLTGSSNRPVYNAAARSHVCAAMDGYNAVVFAYGQTASGKTFTLVSFIIVACRSS